MKKLIAPLLVVLLAVLILAGVLLWLFFGAANLQKRLEQPEDAALRPLAEYLAADWPGYELDSCEQATLTLRYPVGSTFEQVRRFGEAAGYPELAASQLETAALIAYGCETNCGVAIREVVVRGISSDGQEVYRASTESGVQGCWEDEALP